MKKLLLLLLLGMALPVLADDVATTLTVHITDGSQVTFLLSERPKVSFSDGCLLITSSEADATYPLSDVLMFTFEETESEATGLSLLPADETSLALEGGAIVVTGLKEGSTAKVYTIGGIMVNSEKVDGGTWTYSLSSLSSGVYIISINGKTFKIAKK